MLSLLCKRLWQEPLAPPSTSTSTARGAHLDPTPPHPDHNPTQLALVVRALRDNQSQCLAPFFTSPQVGGFLHSGGCTQLRSCGLEQPCQTRAACGWAAWWRRASQQAPLNTRRRPSLPPLQAQAVLRGVADRLTAALSSMLYVGAGLGSQEVRGRLSGPAWRPCCT